MAEHQPELRPFPAGRRIVTGAIRAGRRMALMHGLIDVDVTAALDRLRAWDPPLSVSAYVVACVVRAAALHPDVHVYRNWRGRLVLTSEVDVAILVERQTLNGPVPVGHVIRGADTRSVEDVSKEIRSVQAEPSRDIGNRRLDQLSAVARVPGMAALFFRLARRSVRLHDISGTVAVSALGALGGGSGHGIGVPTVLSLNVTVGGMSERPRVVDGEIQPRNVLDLTISADHNVVDGAPAARFAASLRELMESAELLPVAEPTPAATPGAAGR
jgi:pyruvate/2-oxoglutarate dehydrogenase complex dihydrolipoamide acyltransferase (E2) component